MRKPVGSPRRIAVVGRAGAGKTTIALAVGEALGLPVIHLDALFWTADWHAVPRERFEGTHAEAIERDAWVIDGGYLGSAGWPDRARRAEVIVVAEASLLVCLWRVIRRSLRRRTTRPDRPAGGHEQFSPYFLWWIVRWSRRHPHLAATLAGEGHRVIRARTAEDAVREVRAIAARTAGSQRPDRSGRD
jgi:adenylate kinase family enzyme